MATQYSVIHHQLSLSVILELKLLHTVLILLLEIIYSRDS